MGGVRIFYSKQRCKEVKKEAFNIHLLRYTPEEEYYFFDSKDKPKTINEKLCK